MNTAEARSSDLGRLARGGALNFIGAVAYGALSFGLVVVVTAQLGADGTGEFLLAIAAFNIITKVCELGASTGFIRLISHDLAVGLGRRLPVVTAVGLVPVAVAGVVAAAAVAVAASTIGDLVADGSSARAVASHLRVLAPFVPIAALYSVVVQGTRGFGTMRAQVVVDRIGKPLAQVVLVALALAASSGGGTALDLAWAGPVALATVPAGLWFTRLARTAIAGSPTLEPPERRAVASEFWHFSAPRALSQVFAVAVLWFDTLLIGALRSAEEAGIYAASTRYLLIGTFTAEAVMQVLGPNISRLLAQRELAAGEQLFRAATTWQLCLIGPIYAVVIVFAPALLDVFGEEFTVASTALVILSAGIVVSALLGPADTVVLMAGRSRLSLANSAVTLTVNVVGNLVLTPRYGIEGAAVAWAAAIVAAAALPALQLRRATGIQPFGSQPVVALAATAVAVAVPCVAARALLGPTYAGLAVAVAAGAVGAVVAGAALRSRLQLDDLVRSFRDRPGRAVAAR